MSQGFSESSSSVSYFFCTCICNYQDESGSLFNVTGDTHTYTPLSSGPKKILLIKIGKIRKTFRQRYKHKLTTRNQSFHPSIHLSLYYSYYYYYYLSIHLYIYTSIYICKSLIYPPISPSIHSSIRPSIQ